MRVFNVISACLVSFIFVGVSPVLIPVMVQTTEALRSVHFGFPIAFVRQQLVTSRTPPLRVAAGSPLDNPTEILWGNFLLSVVLCTVVLFLILEAVRLMGMRKKNG